MESPQDRALKRKRVRRLRVLQQIASNAPHAISEKIILTGLLQEIDLLLTKEVLRQEMDYLHELHLIRCEVVDDIWAAKILPLGTDFLDGLITVGFEGILRV